MSRPTYNAILQYAKSKPAIVFAPTRRHAKQIAADLMTYTAGDANPTRFLKVRPRPCLSGQPAFMPFLRLCTW
jgi:superfamily II DNA/RNA helicase